MARSKPKTEVIADPKQAEAAMMELAELERKIKTLDLTAQDIIDATKAKAKREAEPHLARKKELENALCTYASLNKGELFGKRKSVETPFGLFGFRKVSKLLTLPKLTLQNVLERLQELNITEAIRTKRSVDKAAMQDWPDTRLEAVGMRRMVQDEFFIEPAQDIETKE